MNFPEHRPLKQASLTAFYHFILALFVPASAPEPDYKRFYTILLTESCLRRCCFGVWGRILKTTRKSGLY